MKTVSTDRMISDPGSSALEGRVAWVPAKSLWTLAMTAIALVAGPMTARWDAVAVFVALTAVTICLGHSVGMHRLLIHRAFRTPIAVEHFLVYLGTLVGMAGPFGMIHAHDIRDWAQRQDACHDLYAHRRPFLVDAWWQMHCRVVLDRPPRFVIEDRVRNDRFYRFVERTWMAQQLPLAVLLYAFGGWAWVVWGIAVRVSVSLTGHWLVGHFAHRRGDQDWRVEGVAVQGYNVRGAGLVTFGEAYHGNHHAFPQSARLGFGPGQVDLGWWFICLLAALGLAREIRTPDNLEWRKGLVRLAQSETPDGARAFQGQMETFCFASGAAIRAKGRAARSGATGKRGDKAGARRTETRRAGHVCPDAFGLWLDRAPARPAPDPSISGQTCSGRMLPSDPERL